MAETDPAVADQLLVQAFARLRPKALGLSCGIVAGLGLFLATAVLLVKAALATGPARPIGPHLGLLGHYFPGYTVSWPGAFVGLAWGFAAGFLVGVVMASLVNLNHAVYLKLLKRKIRRAVYFDEL